jgi:hypothetical protein
MVIWVMAAAALLATPAQAQDLDAGKSAAQLFGEVCTACHKSARELKRPTAAFLRQHYTSSSEAASAIAGYLAGVPSDPRAAQPKRPPAPSPATGPAANAAPTTLATPEANRRPAVAPERDQAKSAPGQALPKGRRPPPTAATAEAAKPPVEEKLPEPPPAPPPPALEPFEE